MAKIVVISRKALYLHLKNKSRGALAHLARASDWQSEGDRFESDMLHNLTASNKKRHSFLNAFFYYHLSYFFAVANSVSIGSSYCFCNLCSSVFRLSIKASLPGSL